MNNSNLLNIWNNFDESTHEQIIKNVCIYMKKNMKNSNEKLNWNRYIKNRFNKLFNILISNNLINKNEEKLINETYKYFDMFLYETNIKLINDSISFDNIYYINNKLEFKRTHKKISAPSDYILKNIYLLTKYPNEFCNNIKNLDRVILYIRKYYPDIVNIKFLYKRLSIYNIIFFMTKYIENPEKNYYKSYIIEEISSLNLSKTKSFYDLKTPEELMNFMDYNIDFGWKDKYGLIHYNNIKNIRKDYLICSIDDIVNNGIGLCIEQAKLAKYFFDKNNITNKLYCYRVYENENDLNRDVKLHCFLLFKKGNYWYYFEHSYDSKKGIFKFNTIKDALSSFTKDYLERGDTRKLTEISQIPDNINFYEFNKFVNSFDK